MIAVYFWNASRRDYFSSQTAFAGKRSRQVVIAFAVATGILGFGAAKGHRKGRVVHTTTRLAVAASSQIFGNLYADRAARWRAWESCIFIARDTVAAGAWARSRGPARQGGEVKVGAGAIAIGAVQGLCLPFRGFSRSGATISTGLLAGVTRQAAERFILCARSGGAIARRRSWRARHSDCFQAEAGDARAEGRTRPDRATSRARRAWWNRMVFSFLAGLVALKWLSGWLESAQMAVVRRVLTGGGGSWCFSWRRGVFSLRTPPARRRAARSRRACRAACRCPVR